MSKPMSVRKYIKKKNKIFKKLTGITMIPKDQIIDMEPIALSNCDAINQCPYCIVWNITPGCVGCPMSKADNNCKAEYSTYNQINGIVSTHRNHKLRKLVRKYNKSHGFEERI